MHWKNEIEFRKMYLIKKLNPIKKTLLDFDFLDFDTDKSIVYLEKLFFQFVEIIFFLLDCFKVN